MSFYTRKEKFKDMQNDNLAQCMRDFQAANPKDDASLNFVTELKEEIVDRFCYEYFDRPYAEMLAENERDLEEAEFMIEKNVN